jgi:hypothetical protein
MMTWAESAAAWLQSHPGWHRTRWIAEGIGHPNPRSFAQVLAQVPGIEHVTRMPFEGDSWRLHSPRSPAPPEA